MLGLAALARRALRDRRPAERVRATQEPVVQQIKIFKSIESDVTDLERDINAWLKESGARVVNIFGNIAPQTITDADKAKGTRGFSPSDVLVALLYETD